MQKAVAWSPRKAQPTVGCWSRHARPRGSEKRRPATKQTEPRPHSKTRFPSRGQTGGEGQSGVDSGFSSAFAGCDLEHIPEQISESKCSGISGAGKQGQAGPGGHGKDLE